MSNPSPETIERQARASDPKRSAWVSANAGSGKTYVLVQRVVRLLLDGADPSRILCLTFTKAAAANMQNRVVEKLRGWATDSDQKLAEEIEKLEGVRPNTRRLAAARKLFARALETPGGLKIYTIHAFCGRLLHQFPFEANAPAGFSELDDRDQADLLAESQAKVLAAAARAPDGPIGKALAYLVARHAEPTIRDTLNAAIAQRGALREAIAPGRLDQIDAATAALATMFGLSTADDEEALQASILGDGIPASEWPGLAETLRLGSTTDVDLGDRFAGAARTALESDRREIYLGVFFTDQGKPRSRFVTAKTRKDNPTLAVALDRELVRLASVVSSLRSASVIARTRALLILADAAIQAYSDAKAARALLDYEDLIVKAGRLLSHAENAWVLYKLDGGLDHILVDEAQDTSPPQWSIVRALAEEFLAGANARPDVYRTIFAVGDEKQSIFGFQGANPRSFGEERRFYERAYEALQAIFDPIPLTESFRSAAAVLAGVDAVFARREAHHGLSSDEEIATLHTTTRATEAGSVELWPLVAAEAGAHAEEAWDAPFDRVNPQSAVVLLARKIAEEIHRAHYENGVKFGEVVVLVRQRKALFEAVIRAMKAKGVPVAGADRLIVGEHIAVMDLLALGDAIVTPDDDLALACALKSPLFGLDDDDLIAVAPLRKQQRLVDALAEGEPHVRAAREKFLGYVEEARRRTPFGFLSWLLSKERLRQRFRARLGHEVDDPLDALLDLAQDFGRTHPPTLAGFLRWMRAAPAELKRDLDVSSGEVRVMTVHGAKGLEAELVILADTVGGATSGRSPSLIKVPLPGGVRLPVWAGRKEDDPQPIADARQWMLADAEAEHRRLLYVAMTRAKDRLIVCGHDPRKNPAHKLPDSNWHDLVREGMLEAAGVEIAEPGAEIWSLRLASGEPKPVSPSQESLELPAGKPGWLAAPAPFEAAPGPPLSPSALVAEDTETARFVAGPASEAARARGVLLHRLLKTLPDVAEDRRASVAERMVAGVGALEEAMRAEIARSALALVADPDFAEVFAPDGRGETPIVGVLKDGTPVSGRIDRLAVSPERVLVVDYKTDRSPPPPGAPPPAAYVAQLSAYAALLREIWPDRPIVAAILWTAAPRLDRIALDAGPFA